MLADDVIQNVRRVGVSFLPRRSSNLELIKPHSTPGIVIRELIYI